MHIISPITNHVFISSLDTQICTHL